MRTATAFVPEPIWLGTTEVVKLFPGLTLRKLQWWDEHKIVVAARGYGHAGGGELRLYDAPRLEMIGIVQRLRKASIGGIRLGKVLRNLKHCGGPAPWLIVLQSCTVYLAMDEREAAQKLAKSGQFGALINVEEIRETIRGAHGWK